MVARLQAILSRLDDPLARVTSLATGIACIAVILMALHVTLDVAMRYLLNSPIPGTAEIVSYYYMVSVVVFPVAYLERLDRHVTVDLAYGYFPPWAKRISFTFSCLMTALFFSLFAYKSWLSAVDAFLSREVIMGMAAIEIWPARFVLPFSFGLLVLAALLRTMSTIASPAQVPRG